MTINNQKVYPGNPCPILVLNSGCSDYENRPAMPCKVYRCEWLKSPDMPERFKPSLINLIVHKRWIKNNEYHTLIPAGIEIKVSDIEDIFLWFNEHGFNFFYTYESNKYICGSSEFLKECYNNKDFNNK